MNTVRFILFFVVLASCSSQSNVVKKNETILYIHFIDDFKNNNVSLTINDNFIFKDKLFRESDIPQLRMRKQMFIKVKSDLTEIHSSNISVDTVKMNIDLDNNVTLKLNVDDHLKESSFKLYKKSNYFFISFNNGNPDIKHSKVFYE